jgi:ribosome-binding factor A
MKLAELMLREVHDPRVAGVTVTRIELARDSSQAQVWYRPLPFGRPPEEAAAGLRSVAGFLRRELGRAMHLRRAPELRFEVDPLPDQGQRIEDLLLGLGPLGSRPGAADDEPGGGDAADEPGGGAADEPGGGGDAADE